MNLLDLKKENEALYEKEKELQNEICRSKPIQLTIADTRICNLNCVMCQKNAKRYSNPILYRLKRLKFFGKAVNKLNNFRLTYYKDAIMDFSLFEKIANEIFPYLNYVYPTVSGEPFIS